MPSTPPRWRRAGRAPEVIVPGTVAEVVDAAERTLGLVAEAGGTLRGGLAALPCGIAGSGEVTLRVAAAPAPARAATVTLDVPPAPRVPYVGWVVVLATSFAHWRALRWAGAAIEADRHGRPAPRVPHGLGLVPPVPVTSEQAARLATIIFFGLLANVQGAMLTQFVGAAADTFGASDRDIGAGLAVVRAGALVSMIAAAFADRVGRRRVLVWGLGATSVGSAATAMAGGFGQVVAAQLVVRSLTTAILVVAAIAVVEEAPEGARAWAVGLMGVGLGAGFGLSVFLLPLADIGAGQGWRAAFAVGATTGLFLPGLRRRVRETRRYKAAEVRVSHRGRISQIVGAHSRMRFLALTLAVFLINVFNAPSSQLTNRFLVDERDFSNTAVAVYRIAALALPGLVGVLLGGVLAERWGRRPVGAVGVAIAALLQMAFFVTSGPTMWLASGLSLLAAAAAWVALGAIGAELFPTEVRATSGGILLVVGVAGSAVGLITATWLADPVGSLGTAVALCGLAPLVTAAFILPWLPETRDRRLDEISPSEP